MIEQRLSELIPDAPDSLTKAMRYGLLGGGKLLRPRLVLATAETLGADPRIALDPACALEMIHAYSLIHDDLPCMDNDDFRRGRPTLHKAFPEGIAVLAGDALLTEAFNVIANAPLADHQKIKLIATLSIRSGRIGMIKGQALDIAGHKTPEIDALKTGELFCCAFEFGAIIANSDLLPAMQRLGHLLGLAYQIRDDIEDGAKNLDLKPYLFELNKLLSDLPQNGVPIKTIIDPLFKS